MCHKNLLIYQKIIHSWLNSNPGEPYMELASSLSDLITSVWGFLWQINLVLYTVLMPLFHIWWLRFADNELVTFLLMLQIYVDVPVLLVAFLCIVKFQVVVTLMFFSSRSAFGFVLLGHQTFCGICYTSKL